MCVIKISICDMQYKISKPQSIKYICTCVQCTMQVVHPFCQVLSRGLCVFLKGGEKAVSDTKCHIGRDINCRSDATSRAAQNCYTCAWTLSVSIQPTFSLKSLSHHLDVTSQVTKCHIGHDINCWSDATSRAARCFCPVCIRLISSFEIIFTLVTLGATLTAGVTRRPEQLGFVSQLFCYTRAWSFSLSLFEIIFTSLS